MITINYEQAHDVVKNNKFLHWDGWDIVDFKTDANAEFDKRGIRYNNRWGFEKRFSPDHEGWKVPKRYVR
jgi:hypothetical protein